MSSDSLSMSSPFVDRRSQPASISPEYRERRQFANSYAELSADARELAMAIDGYKFRHRRRFINYEEMLAVIKELGYQRPSVSSDL